MKPAPIQPSPSASGGRGRPRLDLALRARNQCWYWLVKRALGLSDDELDRRFADNYRAQSRARVFTRIRTQGNSPNTRQGLRAGGSVYERVHAAEHPDLPRARIAFESPLWDLLLDPQRPLADYTAQIQVIVDRRGWYRASGDDLVDGLQMGLNERIFEFAPDLTPSFQAMFEHLVEIQPDIEALTLLCLLFREAHAAMYLEQAVAIRRRLCEVTRRYGAASGFPGSLIALLERLVVDRIGYGRVINEDAGAARLSSSDRPSTGPRPAQIRSVLRAYSSGDMSGGGVAHLRTPIVQQGPAWNLAMSALRVEREGRRVKAEQAARELSGLPRDPELEAAFARYLFESLEHVDAQAPDGSVMLHLNHPG